MAEGAVLMEAGPQATPAALPRSPLPSNTASVRGGCEWFVEVAVGSVPARTDEGNDGLERHGLDCHFRSCRESILREPMLEPSNNASKSLVRLREAPYVLCRHMERRAGK